NGVLIVGPRLTGSDQAEKLAVGPEVRVAVMLRWGSLPQAASRASWTSEMSLRVGTVVMEPPLQRASARRLKIDSDVTHPGRCENGCGVARPVRRVDAVGVERAVREKAVIIHGHVGTRDGDQREVGVAASEFLAA